MNVTIKQNDRRGFTLNYFGAIIKREMDRHERVATFSIKLPGQTARQMDPTYYIAELWSARNRVAGERPMIMKTIDAEIRRYQDLCV